MKFRTQSLNFSILIFLLTLFVQADGQSKKNKVTKVPSTPQVRFVSGKSSLKIPFDLSNNLILVQVGVNNSAPFWFIFDTGATNTVIDNQLAKELHLKSNGAEQAKGSEGTTEAVIFKGVSLHLPNIESANQTIYGLPIDSFSLLFGRKIGGIIGNDVIKEFVVEVDYTSQIINLYEPQSYRYSGDGEMIPFVIEGKKPFIRASITLEGKNALDGKFLLDTGSDGAVSLNTPFVNRNQLLKSLSKTNQIISGGVGGTQKSLSGRIKNMKLGRFTLENPITDFSQGTLGDSASAKYGGLIGGEIFRRFKVIFDYSRRRMILEPNAQFSQPYEVDMSGLSLVADGDNLATVLVDEVEANSPASESGIQGEDIITAIDSRPVAEFTLDKIRKLFMQNGREYLISLKRGDKEFQIKLKMRRLI
jgi:predicted aspartyl protease